MAKIASVEDLFGLPAIRSEKDPVALAKLAEAKTELEKAIAALPTDQDLEKLSDALAELDLNKADKTDAEALQTAIEELNTAIAAGATQEELDAAIKKVEDAIAAIPKGVQPPKIIYTTATTITVAIGDEVHIEGAGDIQLPAAPSDGSELKVFDNFGNIKAGKNNILAGAGDTWQMPDGTFDTTPLEFDVDDQLRHGRMTLKYTAKTKSWWALVVYAKPVGVTSGGGDRLVTVVLPLLPANQWINYPLPTGNDAGKAILSSRILDSDGSDITWALDTRVREGVRQVFSLVDQVNLQFEYEVQS